MIKISQPTASKLLVEANSFELLTFLIFPIILLIIGVIAIILAVDSFAEFFRSGSTSILLHAAIGLVSFCGAYLFLKYYPVGQRTIFDSQLQKLTVITRTVFGIKLTEYDFEQMADVALLGSDHSYTIGVKLKNGSDISLNGMVVYTNNRVDEMRKKIIQIRDFLGFLDN